MKEMVEKDFDLFELDLEISARNFFRNPLKEVQNALSALPSGIIPIRFAVVAYENDRIKCEVGLMNSILLPENHYHNSTIFDFKLCTKACESFNVALLIPTGIGATIGGHAGDAGPVAILISEVCDTLIVHPNIVNASDINELPENCLYVEGSVLSRLLMGTVSLLPIRTNKVLILVEKHKDKYFTNAAINAVNAAVSSYGFDCSGIVTIEPIEMKFKYSSSGRATGIVKSLENIFSAVEKHKHPFDAIALTTHIQVPKKTKKSYYKTPDNCANPWGGIEALLTHSISEVFRIPSAHSPMMSSETELIEFPVVDPRVAAEIVSITYLQSILKGIKRSPRICAKTESTKAISASDISAIVIPEGCIGLPTLAALRQDIPVIVVRENKNLMRNDLTKLPWKNGQLWIVENYWEAVGILSALKSGINPYSVRRPLEAVKVSRVKTKYKKNKRR
jgi:hypothetical protein